MRPAGSPRGSATNRSSGTFAALTGKAGMSDELLNALDAADRLISRLEELVADHLSKKDALDETRAFYDVVEALETAPEVAKVRMALGRDPERFGEDTPVAHGGNTG